MKPNTIRIIFVVLFAFISVGSLIGFLYLGFMTAFGVGWGGGKISYGELFWIWKGIVVLFVLSTFSFIGMAKPKKYGLIIAYAIPFGFGAYVLLSFIRFTIYDFGNDEGLDFSYLIRLLVQIIIIVGTLSLFTLGLNKIKNQYFKFVPKDYGISVGLSIILFLSMYFMLDY